MAAGTLFGLCVGNRMADQRYQDWRFTMHELTPLMDPRIQFTLDNLIDGVKTESIICWQALDTHTGGIVLIIGRHIEENKVLPLAILQPDSMATVKRYAPSKPGGGWEMSQIEGSKIILPKQSSNGPKESK